MGLLKPRTATIPIYQGDDLEHLAELYRAVERAEAAMKAAKGTPLRAGDEVPSAQAERDAYNVAVDEAAERAVFVTLTTIGPTRWRNLLAEHPPRTVAAPVPAPGETAVVDGKTELVEEDEAYEVNTETFPMALLTYNRDGVRTTSATVGDRAASEAEVTEFISNEVAAGDIERLWITAYWLNRARGSDPKDSKFSTDSPRSDEN